MRSRSLTKKIVSLLFFGVVATYIVTNTDFFFLGNIRRLVHKLNPDSRLHSRSLNTIEHLQHSNNGCKYKSKIKGLDRTSLGFAIKPEYQTLPNYYWKYNVLSNNKWQNQRPSKRFCNKKAPIQIKRVLIYHLTEWLDFTECPNYNYVHPDLKCEFIHWVTTQPSSSISLKDIASDLDAIFIHRDRDHDDVIDFELEEIYQNSKSAINNRSKALSKLPKLIYFTLESPTPPDDFQFQAKPKYKDIDGSTRDFLGAYWRGSDIYLPYFRWQYFDQRIISKPQERNFAEGRSKGAAIVVSNCGANNGRLELVQELQKYFPVDVFGKCGTLACPKDGCFPNISKNYKFYLAFENSNCRDYITEKLHRNGYMNDLLPIVFGAHQVDYKAIAPANSYIHVEDFESIQKLGLYLQLLTKNDTLYNNYFKWKGTGEFVSWNLKCELCAFLHAQSDTGSHLDGKNKPHLQPYFNKEKIYHFQVFNWSSTDERLCLRDNQWYWNK